MPVEKDEAPEMEAIALETVELIVTSPIREPPRMVVQLIPNRAGI